MIVTPNTTLATSSERPAVGAKQNELPRQQSSGSTAVRLSIDELVLDGFAASSRHAIRDATERELTRLLAAGDFAWASEDAYWSRRDAGSLQVSAGLSPSETGRRLAVAILKGVSP